jgi:glycosyltransferase involved in cell wall biosynthesis
MSGGLIDEIVIQDDCSEDYDLLKPHESENVRLFKNEKNLSPLLSRVNLVKNCKNDWVLLMDSDNFLEKNCFDYTVCSLLFLL